MLQAKFNEAIRMIYNGKLPPRLGIALSGGIDSMCLASLLHNHIITNKIDTKLYPITINHNLRTASSLEIPIIRQSLQKMGIAAQNHLTRSVNVRSKIASASASFEEAARMERYEALTELCQLNNIKDLMVAHHLDDQLETFVMRLFGNSGVFGLSAMDWKSSTTSVNIPEKLSIVRPMLEMEKSEIYSYCIENDVQWVQDYTNFEEINKRNTIRKYFIDHPRLKNETNQVFHEVRKFTKYLDSQVNRLYEKLEQTGKIQRDEAMSMMMIALNNDQLDKNSDLVIARLLFKMLYPISPSRNYHYSFNKLLQSIPNSKNDLTTFSLLQLQWRAKHTDEGIHITVQRQNLRDPIVQKITIDPMKETEWMLFDNRFWFKLMNTTDQQQNYSLRTLMKGDKKNFKEVPKDFKYSTMSNLPVLWDDQTEKIISMPTRETGNSCIQWKLKENIYTF